MKKPTSTQTKPRSCSTDAVAAGLAMSIIEENRKKGHTISIPSLGIEIKPEWDDPKTNITTSIDDDY